MNVSMILVEIYFRIFDFPFRLWNFVQRKFGQKRVFTADSFKSDSESTDYSKFVLEAASIDSVFQNFRKNYYYRQILEHVDYFLGRKYFNQLSAVSLELMKQSAQIIELSKIGQPRKYKFPKIGLVSPTLIRYQFVAQELERIFGSSLGEDIAEIGVGFGGQYLVLQENFDFKKYTMFDLPQVLRLTEKVISEAAGDLQKVIKGNIQEPRVQNCDLVISNYAFSELPRDIQKSYIDGVLKNSKRGYLIMNSGRSDISGRSAGKYSLDELKSLLPQIEVLEETPLTGPDNYIIIWGR